jgi:hypothetical protein
MTIGLRVKKFSFLELAGIALAQAYYRLTGAKLALLIRRLGFFQR